MEKNCHFLGNTIDISLINLIPRLLPAITPSSLSPMGPWRQISGISTSLSVSQCHSQWYFTPNTHVNMAANDFRFFDIL